MGLYTGKENIGTRTELHIQYLEAKYQKVYRCVIIAINHFALIRSICLLVLLKRTSQIASLKAEGFNEQWDEGIVETGRTTLARHLNPAVVCELMMYGSRCPKAGVHLRRLPCNSVKPLGRSASSSGLDLRPGSQHSASSFQGKGERAFTWEADADGNGYFAWMMTPLSTTCSVSHNGGV